MGYVSWDPAPMGLAYQQTWPPPVTVILQLTPDPFEEGDIRLPGEQTCTAEIRAFTEQQRATRTYLTKEELVAFSQGDHPAARDVAEAVLRMNESDHIVTTQECDDAFGILADWETNGQGDRSPAERDFIASLSDAPQPRAGMEMTT